MKKALIGYTGFVGSNLKDNTFEGLYNSKNIENIQNKHYNLIICAGVPAEKWRANKKPEKDLKNIRRLIKNLGKVTADEFILISTIDVYPNTINVDEDTLINKKLLNPYGTNRVLLEEFVQKCAKEEVLSSQMKTKESLSIFFHILQNIDKPKLMSI